MTSSHFSIISRLTVRFIFPVLFVFILGCADSEKELELLPGETRFNEPLPSFSKETLNGDLLTTDDFKGKVSLVNFWATWCGPCIIETPELVGLQEEWKDRPFQIIGVSMDEGGFDLVQGFVDDFMVNYPQIHDEGPLADQFGGVYALPTTFIVDGEGTILSSFLGIFPFEQRRDMLEDLLDDLES